MIKLNGTINTQQVQYLGKVVTIILVDVEFNKLYFTASSVKEAKKKAQAYLAPLNKRIGTLTTI